MSNSPRKTIPIDDEEVGLVQADTLTLDAAFDFLYVDHPKLTHAHKVAILLRRIRKLESSGARIIY